MPLQSHFQGPELVLVIVVAVPVAHKLVDGATLNVPLLLVPHVPSVTVRVNVDVTLVAEFTVTVQVAVPLHAPDHPVKVLPLEGAAVRVTEVPVVMEAEQVEPQLMPPVEEAIVPAPVPDLVTERVKESKAPDCPERTGQT